MSRPGPVFCIDGRPPRAIGNPLEKFPQARAEKRDRENDRGREYRPPHSSLSSHEEARTHR